MWREKVIGFVGKATGLLLWDEDELSHLHGSRWFDIAKQGGLVAVRNESQLADGRKAFVVAPEDAS